MLEILAKLGPVAASGAAAIVAFLVYRVNAEKLFLEMLAARREAVREVLDAAHARDVEISRLPAQIGRPDAYDLPEQARFWRSTSAAEGLFGDEVGRALSDLDSALMEKIASVFGLRSPHDDLTAEREALLRHSRAVDNLLTTRAAFVSRTSPYTKLGRRGLPMIERLRLWRNDRVSRRN